MKRDTLEELAEVKKTVVGDLRTAMENKNQRFNKKDSSEALKSKEVAKNGNGEANVGEMKCENGSVKEVKEATSDILAAGGKSGAGERGRGAGSCSGEGRGSLCDGGGRQRLHSSASAGLEGGGEGCQISRISHQNRARPSLQGQQGAFMGRGELTLTVSG